MKLVLQRVSQAYVTVEGVAVSSIAHGLVVFLCIEKGDTDDQISHYAGKVVELRIFSDEQGKMNRSLKEVRGEILLISQFTLAGDAEKGRRPSFDKAAPPEVAKIFYERFARSIAEQGVHVVTGVFQAHMQVGLVNDGPVTIILGM